MAKYKEPTLASKFLIKTGMLFYGNRLVKNRLNLKINGDVSALKPPYIVLANHSSFGETACLTKLLLPNVANTIGAHAQFVGKGWIMRHVGVVPKRQFVKDLTVVRDVKYMLSKNRPVVIYPEGKLSVVGTANRIMPSCAKLVRMMKVPLVVAIFEGSYLFRPRWAKSRRSVTVTANLHVLTADEISSMSVDELFARIQGLFCYDDYAYQLKNKIRIDSDDLVEGLNTILYKCPHCKTEFSIGAAGNKLCCLSCGSVFAMNEYGQLSSKKGGFDKVTDWYEWQRASVAEAVRKDYVFEADCKVEELPDLKKYRLLGAGHFRHDLNGIELTLPSGEKVLFKSSELYTLSFDETHIYLSVVDNTYRLTFEGVNGELTKDNLATEEIYKLFEQSKE